MQWKTRCENSHKIKTIWWPLWYSPYDKAPYDMAPYDMAPYDMAPYNMTHIKWLYVTLTKSYKNLTWRTSPEMNAKITYFLSLLSFDRNKNLLKVQVNLFEIIQHQSIVWFNPSSSFQLFNLSKSILQVHTRQTPF